MHKINLLLCIIPYLWGLSSCKVNNWTIEDARPANISSDTVLHAAHAAIVNIEDICHPAPTPELHASTIEETPSGLVAAWFGGTKEKNPDVGIWLSRHENNVWTTPEEVVTGITTLADGTEVRYPCWNPVLYQIPDGGPLLLFYKVGPTSPEWWGMLMRSSDGGVTWSTPVRLPNGIYGPIKNKPVKIGQQGILSPASITSRLHFERSDDLGYTWTRTPAVTDRSIPAIQPSILFHGGDTLQAVGRTLQDQRVFSIWSNDGGTTWGDLNLLNVPNPNSGNDAVTLQDGRQLMVYNHSETARTPLNVSLSDDGITWHPILVLENDKEGGYSYPAVIQSQDGLVHITYSWRRKNIRHVVLDPTKLSGKPLLSWSFENAGIQGNESSSAAAFTDVALETAILTRGSGISPQKATNSFASAFPIHLDQQAAENGNAYYQFNVKGKTGKKLSLKSLSAVLRVQTDAPKTYLWKYSIDNGVSFHNIGSPIPISTGFTNNNGIQQPFIDLNSITALQNIPSSTEVLFRLYAWGGSSTSTNNGFRIGKSNALTPALTLNGKVE